MKDVKINIKNFLQMMIHADAGANVVTKTDTNSYMYVSSNHKCKENSFKMTPVIVTDTSVSSLRSHLSKVQWN